MSLAYAFVQGQWLQCSADTYLAVSGRSEREWEMIVDEWREQQRANGRKRVSIDGYEIAKFLEEVLTEEALLQQQQRDLEGMSIREAIGGSHDRSEKERPSETEAQMDDDELDLATLPKLEEYR